MTDFDYMTQVLCIRDARAESGDAEGARLAQALAEHLWGFTRQTPALSSRIERFAPTQAAEEHYVNEK